MLRICLGSLTGVKLHSFGIHKLMGRCKAGGEGGGLNASDEAANIGRNRSFASAYLG